MRDQILRNTLIILLLLFNENMSFQMLASTVESDVTALQAISLGWQATNLNWNGNDPCGSGWRGVSCDQSTNTMVEQLSLSSVGLQGRLLPSISNLLNLQILDLSFNPNLTGPIPASIGSMVKLTNLNLQNCGFMGNIPPSLGNLKNLQFLALNRNYLNGGIPSSLGGLGALTWFDLSENSLSGGLPVSSMSRNNVGLDKLLKAQHFHLNNNTLSGFIPKEICSLPNLIHLLLDSNNFSGAIPAEISNLASLQILRLDENGFEGEIPTSINKLTSLTELHLSNNNLNGSLPTLSGPPSLMLVRLSQNNFNPQAIPAWILNLTNLQTLEMDNNSLIGEIPPNLLDLPNLESLSLQFNQINGSLQLNMTAPSLTEISLENNNITNVLGYRNDIQFQLSLEANPVCSGNQLSYSSSVCSGNHLASWIRDPSSCKTTFCPDSKTQNPITCLCAFPLVIQFQFIAPSFSNVDTPRIHSLETQLETVLSLSSQQVVAGSANFTDNHRLLANILFFPSGSSESLNEAEVSNIVSQLSLQNVQLPEFGPFIVRPVVLPPAGSKSSSSLGSAAIVGICIGAVAGFVVLLCIGLYAVRQKRRADKAEATTNPFASWGAVNKDNGSAPNLKGARWFPYAELKSATDNFNDTNQIGIGGYGKVYKGILASGDVVAIKRAQKESMQGATEFKNEIELLSRLHHKNLVGLVGFCYEQGEQMLVYEYMPNGTLRDHLEKGGSEYFDWKKRLEIALGSARGLSYLHELANPPIIHRDVKSANILLDEKFVAKVADFGLSKHVDDGKGHVSTQVKGTMGYLDPEYYMTQQLSEKSDVYSYGVVLLEIITARQPIERGKYIVREVRTALEEGGLLALRTLLDPSLCSYPTRDMEIYLELSFSCVEEMAARRPSMSQVVKELEVLLANASSPGFGEDNANDRKSAHDHYRK